MTINIDLVIIIPTGVVGGVGGTIPAETTTTTAPGGEVAGVSGFFQRPIAPAVASSPTALPATGSSSSGTMAAMGAVLLTAGGGLWAAARKPRKR